MKIKSRPEDFFVEEILGTPILAKGGHALYVLEKKSANTLSVLEILSQKLKLPISSFGYGGRKDKHAHTKQYITIKNKRSSGEIKSANWSLKPAGFLDRPMGPDLIGSNSFNVVVRDISGEELKIYDECLEKIGQYGFINYFDDQRFGTLDPIQGFLAQKILKGHFNGALKIYITRVSSEDNKEEMLRKKSIFDKWGDWNACMLKAKTQFEIMAFKHLLAKPKDFIPPLRKIPTHDLTLYFSAYQAYLWNETTRRLAAQKINDPVKTHGVAGEYVFFNSLNTADLDYWQNLTIPTAGSKMEFSDPLVEKISAEILSKEELKLPQFNITKIRQAYFKSTDRRAVVIPVGLSFKAEDDEFNPTRFKLTLKFLLQRGSYATMLFKRLLAK